MPPMARMDDYDKCFLDVEPGTKATYCMITSLIKPNESSEIWQIVNVRTNFTSNELFKCFRRMRFPISIFIMVFV